MSEDTKPRRVQLSRKKGWRIPTNTVKADRTTGFGNPFPIVKGNMGVTTDCWVIGTWTGPGMWFRDTQDEAVELAVKAFRAWITHPAQQSLLNKARKTLKGKNIACWCPLNKPCHTDVLLELANSIVTNLS